MDWDDPNQRFIDLTGDGHADILITEDNVFTYHASLAEEGFDQAEKVYQPFDDELGPRLLVADATVSIAVADMSGDGLADLVRIRNGEVCYWPNLGYGRFGAKVTLDNSPWFDRPDQFDPKRLRLADIDGSGTTDLIYLGRNRIAIYRNLCRQPPHRRGAPGPVSIGRQSHCGPGLRSARQRHRLPRLVVALVGRRSAHRCATSI